MVYIQTHQQKVQSLYRRALKLSLDWTVKRDLWRGQALYIRSLFDAQKDVRDVKLQRNIVAETEEILKTYRHPEPYRVPTAPGGTKFERNLPVPILDPPPHIPGLSDDIHPRTTDSDNLTNGESGEKKETLLDQWEAAKKQSQKEEPESEELERAIREWEKARRIPT